ncbi:probable RNA polymerase II nuclear localization protein SLC7A6OS [Exaiptasia diaphana]|uniref:Probable RNA polymerase II nuclear localization protein SLC7A6OS n=1 Tax=Exaiptasia diaphana TaxID=2652724 RepID=A0A913WRV9_EXADI|nr:probable RNA polymerase II nuclear localization protein SLC7A6OS [Exaiptasia diaphana]KXJ28036.1 putative RNA polymerase II nuclear localization protein SLC7A6OS [Exaiptasia diaphana]
MAASLECSLNTDQKGVVLRVKRKRTDDAVEALVVSHIIPSKKAHLSSDDVNKPTNDNVTNEVFRLLGTCNERDDSRSKDLLINVSKTKNKIRDDFKTNSKGIKEQTKKKQMKREAKRESHSDARFRIISKLRQDGSSDDVKSTETVDPKLQRTVSSDSSTDSADDEVRRLFTVYDLVRDDLQDDKRTRDSAMEGKTEDTNTILCNSVKMIREKLAVSEVKKPDILEENYVYDYYYAPKSNREFGDVLEITCFDDDDEFYLETADREFEATFEDDDDSNDENNWRNDYPDEGTWSSDEETKPRRMNMGPDFGFSYGMDDDDDIKYDKRAFGEDLTSDEDDELNDYGQPYSLSSRKEVYNEELSDDPDLDNL